VIHSSTAGALCAKSLQGRNRAKKRTDKRRANTVIPPSGMETREREPGIVDGKVYREFSGNAQRCCGTMSTFTTDFLGKSGMRRLPGWAKQVGCSNKARGLVSTSTCTLCTEFPIDTTTAVDYKALPAWGCRICLERESIVKRSDVVVSGISRIAGVCVLGLGLLWASNAAAIPQNSNEDEPKPQKLTVSQQWSVSQLKGGVMNVMTQPTTAVNGPKAQIARLHPGQSKNGESENGKDSDVAFYPGDLTYQGGEVITSLQSHDIYVNCDASCFGYPGQFLNRLGKSDLIHVTDQYVGTTANHRYTVGEGGLITYPVTGVGPLGPNDIITILYAAASVFGTGYGNIYHIFFAPGIDVCDNSALTVCYSPDNIPTFYFCAFHGSVDFPDIGHTLLSVQPYANVPGCQVNQPSPNSAETDSQANVISHELIEAITDPDGTAWWNAYDLVNYGAEIGDECEQAYFIYPNTNIGGHLYEIQPEYSNAVHGCSYHGSE
jgi:hypothetical protein